LYQGTINLKGELFSAFWSEINSLFESQKDSPMLRILPDTKGLNAQYIILQTGVNAGQFLITGFQNCW